MEQPFIVKTKKGNSLLCKFTNDGLKCLISTFWVLDDNLLEDLLQGKAKIIESSKDYISTYKEM